MRISPADVGARVSVRSRLAAPAGHATTTDTIGVLRAWRDGLLEIVRKDESVARIAEGDLVAARAVPPVPQRRVRSVWVEGRPAAALRREGERAWRAQVAEHALRLGPLRGVRLDFTLVPGRWVDLDSLVEVAVAGLRDAGSTLDALIATKGEGSPSGVAITPADPSALAVEPPPGPAAVTATAADLPLPGRRAAKRALRERMTEAWEDRPRLEGEVWADLAIAAARSLLPAMEPALDTLEPVLGRDPRGQPRQEFFPFDDRIVWLRVRRAVAPDPAVTLALGPMAGRAARRC